MSTRCACFRATSATAFIAVAFLLGACTGPSSDPSPPPTSAPSSPTPTPTPTPTVDPRVAEAEASILEAYRGYWAAKVVSYADPDKEQDPSLQRFSDDTALTDAQSTIATLRRSGISMPGEPELSPVVSDVQLGVDSSTARISDCVDATNWQPIYTESGASAAAPDQPTRVVAESTAFVAEGRWLIRTFVIYRDTTC